MYDEQEGLGHPNGGTIGHPRFSAAMKIQERRESRLTSSLIEESQWLDANLIWGESTEIPRWEEAEGCLKGRKETWEDL